MTEQPITVILSARQSTYGLDYWLFEAECRFRDQAGDPWYSEGFINYPKKSVYNNPSLDPATFGSLHTLAESVLELVDSHL